MERYVTAKPRLILDNRQRLSTIGKNVLQLSKLIKLTRPETFTSNVNCSEEKTIECAWVKCKSAWNANRDNASDLCYEVKIFCILVNSQFLLESQSLLSSASTDYRVSYMYLGLVVLLLSTILLSTCIRTSHMPSLWRIEMLTITTSFGSIMFASSYVEEEHQFWYWIAASHFVLAYLQRFELRVLPLKKPPY